MTREQELENLLREARGRAAAGLPRYGLRWNGPTEPVSVPMGDGYWTPWHLAYEALRTVAEAQREACAEACEKVLEEAEQNALTPGRVKTGIGAAVECVDAVRATPPVTEGDK